MLEPHPERWSWPHPQSPQWPPLPATDEKSSSAATARAPASAGCSGSHSRRGCRPSPGEKLAALGQVPTGKSAGLMQLQQNRPANKTTRGYLRDVWDLLGMGSKTRQTCASKARLLAGGGANIVPVNMKAIYTSFKPGPTHTSPHMAPILHYL